MNAAELLTAYLAADDALLAALRRGDVRDEYHPAAIARVEALSALRAALTPAEAPATLDDVRRVAATILPGEHECTVTTEPAGVDGGVHVVAKVRAYGDDSSDAVILRASRPTLDEALLVIGRRVAALAGVTP